MVQAQDDDAHDAQKTQEDTTAGLYNDEAW